jgi:hypothetical protein
LIRRHVPLEKVVSWLKRGQYVQFLKEICYMTTIAQILLRNRTTAHTEYVFGYLSYYFGEVLLILALV